MALGIRHRIFVLCLVSLLPAHFIFSQTEFKRAGDYYALYHQGQALTPYVFTEVSSFVEGKAWVNKGELYGYIDTLGNSITSFSFADVSSYRHGFAIVSQDTNGGNFGIINQQGIPLCDLKYDRIKDIVSGFAAVQKDSSWGLMDTSGVEAITPQFDHPPIIISSSFIIVSKNDKWGVINSSGNIQYEFIFDLITADGTAYTKNSKQYLGLL